jgi:hypothetical protein
MSVMRSEADWYYSEEPAIKKLRCTFCRGPLQYPVLWWMPHSGRELRNCNQCRNNDDVCCRDCVSEDIYICRECCCEIVAQGFASDLMQIKNLIALGALGFHEALPNRQSILLAPSENKQ